VNAAGINGTIAAANIGAGTITGTMLVTGSISSDNLAAGSVTSGSLADGAVTLKKLDALPLRLGLVTLTNPTPNGPGSFGSSVASLGNNRVVVGAPGAGGLAGAVYIFNANGTLLTTITNPAPGIHNDFGAAVASAEDDGVLIGTGFFSGASNAYFFSANGTLIRTFAHPAGATDESFGSAVAMVGTDKVLIGAPRNDTGTNDSGAAYLFGTSGALLVTYTNPAPSFIDYFGIAVAGIGNDHVLIGTPQRGGRGGGAYLFDTSGALLRAFTDPTPSPGEEFGSALAAFGTDRVLIGARGCCFLSGAAYLFNINGTRLMTFTNPVPTQGDLFGWSVAAIGTDKVLVGAIMDSTRSGRAYLFDTNGTLLTTLASPTPENDDEFGFSVADLGSDRMIVGADLAAFGKGVAYIFTTHDGAFIPGLFVGGVADGAVTPSMLSADIGPWSRSGTNVFYTGGNVGIGTNAPRTALHVDGVITGNGAGLTQLDAANLISGIVPSLRLSGTYSNSVTFNNSANSFTGSGAGLTALNASQLMSGILPSSRLSGTYSSALTFNNLANFFVGDGSGLMELDASQLIAGTVPLARLPAEVITNGYTGGNVGVGTSTPNAGLHVKKEPIPPGGTFSLEGVTHTYMTFFPDGAGAGRKGYFGFASGASSDMTWANEVSGGDIVLLPGAGGQVGIARARLLSMRWKWKATPRKPRRAVGSPIPMRASRRAFAPSRARWKNWSRFGSWSSATPLNTGRNIRASRIAHI
jgi:hypothetical protein